MRCIVYARRGRGRKADLSVMAERQWLSRVNRALQDEDPTLSAKGGVFGFYSLTTKEEPEGGMGHRHPDRIRSAHMYKWVDKLYGCTSLHPYNLYRGTSCDWSSRSRTSCTAH